MSRYRNFCFTLNNPTDDLTDIYYGLCDPSDSSCRVRYLVIGSEVGESGTPHFQGFISFFNNMSLSAAIAFMPGNPHVEIAATVEEAIVYCKKDGNYFESGTAPSSLAGHNQHQREDWRAIRIACENGQFDLVPDRLRVTMPRNLQFIHHQYIRNRQLQDTTDRHLWYYGPSGTGKSRKARSENPDAYLKPCNRWWDGYLDQEVVIIEDFDKRHSVLIHYMKLWADRYPFPAEIKNSGTMIRPRLVIVTSNYHPEQIWDEPSDLEPILRRFQCWLFAALDVPPQEVVSGAAAPGFTFPP
jgi:hypothetical protein